MSTLWLGACTVCKAEVAFNGEPAQVTCPWGHRADTPKQRRPATTEDLTLTLDAEQMVEVTVTFPYALAREYYLSAFWAWCRASDIRVRSVLETPQRPWQVVLTCSDEQWPRSDAAKVLAYWRRVLGSAVTGGNAAS